ncbi:SDR family oxidoreductase [Candidatus Sororendozoicomonas aggregata]|uniref:SDR family oxidoreductase n=1 Tax=Candidatus Sororendozoicomonas aggregata TaxID=3073239 RepID=UPI002ED283E5
MFSVSSKNVLITGGAQGIGRLFAEKTLLEGGQVVIWDINEAAMNKTATELRSRGGSVSTYVVDIASPASIKQAADQTRSDIGDIDILFNNAGIIVGKDFTDHTSADIERTLNINTAGPMHVASAFLHGMLKNGEARIVNIASAAGLLPNPKMSVYAASKWAVIGWSESLRLEMERGGHDVKVTTVTPGYIDTGMFEGVKPPLLAPIIKPEKIVDLVWEGMKKGKVYVRAPWVVGLLPFFRGILPARVFDFFCGKLLRIYTSMDHFKGHGASRKQPGTPS